MRLKTCWRERTGVNEFEWLEDDQLRGLVDEMMVLEMVHYFLSQLNNSINQIKPYDQDAAAFGYIKKHFLITSLGWSRFTSSGEFE